MKALGNSSKRRLSISQREVVKRETRKQYEKEIKYAEESMQFFMMIAMLETLEEEYGYGEKRRDRFLTLFTKHANSISDFLLSNKCFEGDSDVEVYDRDFNIHHMQQYAKKYKLKFREESLDY